MVRMRWRLFRLWICSRQECLKFWNNRQKSRKIQRRLHDVTRKHSKPIVRLEGVEFAYPARNGAPTSANCQCLTSEVQMGEQWMIVGPSGSGKSTILNLISGAASSTGWCRHRTWHFCPHDESVGASILSHCQHWVRLSRFPLVPYFNVLQNIVSPYRVNPVLDLQQSLERAHTLIRHDWGWCRKKSVCRQNFSR